MKFFTSDQHYFHKNIISYCKRGFSDINKMHKTLIDAHNSAVSENDDVYHLGDFAMLKKDEISKIGPILQKLNGIHHLILGNHDEGKPFTYIRMGFASVHTSLNVNEFFLVHDPAVAVIFNGMNQKILCGHVHQLTKWVNDDILNVGVDVWNYKPLSIEFIRKQWGTRGYI